MPDRVIITVQGAREVERTMREQNRPASPKPIRSDGRLVPMSAFRRKTRRKKGPPLIAAVVQGFGCRPVERSRAAPGPASESLQGRNPRGLAGGLPSMGI
jgi:hypothetical protein